MAAEIIAGVVARLEAFDAAILWTCTRIAHGLQRWTGRTNYTLAAAGIVFQVLVVLTILFRGVAGPLPFLLVWFIVVNTVKLFLNFQNEERLYEGEAPRGSNSTLRIRLMWVAWSLIDMFFICATSSTLQAIEHFFSFGCLVQYYFEAVTPLPPGWLRKLELAQSK